jgi:hypothetical protein
MIGGAPIVCQWPLLFNTDEKISVIFLGKLAFSEKDGFWFGGKFIDAS